MRGHGFGLTHCGLDATGSSAVVAASGFEATVVGAPAVYAIDAS